MSQELIDQLYKEYGVAPIRYRLSQARRGWARTATRSLTVPGWAVLQGERFKLAYVLHEFAHFACGEHGHTARFYEWERKLLHKFGMVPSYGRVYIIELRDLNGNLLWRKEEERQRMAQARVAAGKALEEL